MRLKDRQAGKSLMDGDVIETEEEEGRKGPLFQVTEREREETTGVDDHFGTGAGAFDRFCRPVDAVAVY